MFTERLRFMSFHCESTCCDERVRRYLPLVVDTNAAGPVVYVNLDRCHYSANVAQLVAVGKAGPEAVACHPKLPNSLIIALVFGRSLCVSASKGKSSSRPDKYETACLL